MNFKRNFDDPCHAREIIYFRCNETISYTAIYALDLPAEMTKMVLQFISSPFLPICVSSALRFRTHLN